MPSTALDCLGDLPVPDALQAQVRLLLSAELGFVHQARATMEERLLSRPGEVVLLEARNWLQPSEYFQDALGFGSLVLRRATVLGCRAVAPHVDTRPGQQRLLYWTLHNDGFAFEVDGAAPSRFRPGDVFSFDPGVPHGMRACAQSSPGVWCGLAVPVNAQAYDYWLAALRRATRD